MLNTCAALAVVIVCTWQSNDIVATRIFISFRVDERHQRTVVAGRLKGGLETCVDGPDFGYQKGKLVFLFSKKSRRALGPTQPFVGSEQVERA